MHINTKKNVFSIDCMPVHYGNCSDSIAPITGMYTETGRHPTNSSTYVPLLFNMLISVPLLFKVLISVPLLCKVLISVPLLFKVLISVPLLFKVLISVPLLFKVLSSVPLLFKVLILFADIMNC